MLFSKNIYKITLKKILIFVNNFLSEILKYFLPFSLGSINMMLKYIMHYIMYFCECYKTAYF